MSSKQGIGLVLAALIFSIGPLSGNAEEAKKALYYAMQPAFVVNLSDGSRMRYMQITTQIMSHSDEVLKAVEENQPPLRDAMIMLLAHQSGETMRSVQGREQVRKQALTEVQKVMAKVAGIKKGVEAVYFTDFVIQ